DWILSGVESPLATAARASDGSSSAKALSVANDLVELRESAARLGYPQRVRLLAEQSSAGRAVDQGVELAARALERLEAEGLDVATRDLATLIEHAFGIDVCLSPLGDGFDGLAATTEHARVIVAAVTPVAFRQRFTVAHELAHTLVGDDQGIHTDVDVYS